MLITLTYAYQKENAPVTAETCIIGAKRPLKARKAFHQIHSVPSRCTIRQHSREKPMRRKSPKPRFEHIPVKKTPGMVTSSCVVCKEFIAASDRPKALRIAEKAHKCQRMNG